MHGPRRAGRAPSWTRSGTWPSSSPAPPTTRTSAASSPGSEAADTRENGLDMPVSEPDPDAVQLITVHAAKGLEWDVVAVAGLVDGGLPGDRDPGQGRTEGLGVADRARLAAVPAARRPPRPAGVRVLRRGGPQGAGGAAQAVRARRRRPPGRRGTPARLRRADPRPDRPAPHRGVVGRRQPGAQGLRVPHRARRGRARRERRLGRGARRRVGPTLAPRWSSRRPGPRTPSAPRSGRAAARTSRTRRPASARRWSCPTSAGPSRSAAERRRRAAPVGRARRPAAGRARAGAHDRPARSSSRRTCRHPRWSGWRATRGSSRSTCADRSRPSRHRRRAAAPGSTPGSRAGTAAPPWSTSTRCRVPTTTRRPSTWTSRRSGTRSWRPSGRTGRPSRSRWTSRSRSTATCCAPASTRCSPTPLRAAAEQPGVVVVDWKTGAPPKDEAARASRELQLAVYRLAWSRWTGTPLDQVRAAFCYVGAGATVYPDRLLDEAEITELLRSATQAQGPQGVGAVEPVPNRRGSRTNAPTRRRPGWEGTNAAPRVGRHSRQRPRSSTSTDRRPRRLLWCATAPSGATCSPRRTRASRTARIRSGPGQSRAGIARIGAPAPVSRGAGPARRASSSADMPCSGQVPGDVEVGEERAEVARHLGQPRTELVVGTSRSRRRDRPARSRSSRRPRTRSPRRSPPAAPRRATGGAP